MQTEPVDFDGRSALVQSNAQSAKTPPFSEVLHETNGVNERMKVSPNITCFCSSGLKYKHCCRPYHRGQAAPTPEALMRSRYTAYALHNVAYIIQTTHSNSPHYREDGLTWANELRHFCEQTQFIRLTLISVEDDLSEEQGWVTFRATLTQNGQDASFSERSLFQKHEQVWKYVSGEVELSSADC